MGSATIGRLKHLKPIKHCGLNFDTRTRVSYDCNSEYDYKQSLCFVAERLNQGDWNISLNQSDEIYENNDLL